MTKCSFSEQAPPKLLVSVRDPAEARMAIQAGVDVIDVKEPSLGSLGTAAGDTLEQIVDVVAGLVPCSAACGELADGLEFQEGDRGGEDSSLLDSAHFGEFLATQPTSYKPAYPPQGYAYAKIGLSNCARVPHWRKLYRTWMERLPEGCQPVAVCYADAPDASAPAWALVLREAKRMGCAAILLDTFHKHRGGLLDLWSLGEVAAFIAAARETRMQSAISGSLDLGSIPALLELRPDLIAVRGAICVGDRATSIDPGRLASLVGLFRHDDTLTA